MENETVGTVGRIGEIPIRNIYYLFCYAWNHFREGQSVSTAGIDSPHVADLFATVLVDATKHLLRRHGIDRGYVTHGQDSTCIRGRVDLPETIKRNLAILSRVHCNFDELEDDILHNEILKTTLRNLSRASQLDGRLQHELLQLVSALPNVRLIQLNGLTFRTIQLSSNNAYYGFLMSVCELVYDALLPEEGGRRFRFRDILQDERVMRRVFQQFVRNFYRLEQNGFKVSSERIHWDVEHGDNSSMMLPSMVTDVSLRSKGRTIIIDTKFTPRVFQHFYGSETIQSPHLYQLFAYIKNLEAHDGPDKTAEGLLLYPSALNVVDAAWKVQGHKLRVFTLNLAQHWSGIHHDLLNLLN